MSHSYFKYNYFADFNGIKFCRFNQHKKNNRILSDEELDQELSLYMTGEEGFPPTAVEIDDLAARIVEVQGQIKDLHTLSDMIR
jgi:hypothetical protein